MTPAPERPDQLDGLRRAVDRLNGIGADLHWRSVDDARRWSDGVDFFSRKADEYLAALAAAPVTDAGLREAAQAFDNAVTNHINGGDPDRTIEAVVVARRNLRAALSRQAEKETA